MKIHTVGGQKVKVHTFADGFGKWHAEIHFDEPVGNVWISRWIDNVRSLARKTIRKEIEMRQSDSDFTCRVEVIDNKLNSLNQMSFIEYAEKVN